MDASVIAASCSVFYGGLLVSISLVQPLALTLIQSSVSIASDVL